MRDHPTVSALLRTGHPPGAAGENPDTTAARQAFAADSLPQFFAWLSDADAHIFDRFAAEHSRSYHSWRN